MNACDSGCWLDAGTARLSQLRHPAERNAKAASGETVTRETVTPTKRKLRTRGTVCMIPWVVVRPRLTRNQPQSPPRRPGETKKSYMHEAACALDFDKHEQTVLNQSRLFSFLLSITAGISDNPPLPPPPSRRT